MYTPLVNLNKTKTSRIYYSPLVNNRLPLGSLGHRSIKQLKTKFNVYNFCSFGEKYFNTLFFFQFNNASFFFSSKLRLKNIDFKFIRGLKYNTVFKVNTRLYINNSLSSYCNKLHKRSKLLLFSTQKNINQFCSILKNQIYKINKNKNDHYFSVDGNKLTNILKISLLYEIKEIYSKPLSDLNLIDWNPLLTKSRKISPLGYHFNSKKLSKILNILFYWPNANNYMKEVDKYKKQQPLLIKKRHCLNNSFFLFKVPLTLLRKTLKKERKRMHLTTFNIAIRVICLEMSNFLKNYLIFTKVKCSKKVKLPTKTLNFFFTNSNWVHVLQAEYLFLIYKEFLSTSLEPKHEHDFPPNSLGFRPGRGNFVTIEQLCLSLSLSSNLQNLTKSSLDKKSTLMHLTKDYLFFRKDPLIKDLFYFYGQRPSKYYNIISKGDKDYKYLTKLNNWYLKEKNISSKTKTIRTTFNKKKMFFKETNVLVKQLSNTSNSQQNKKILSVDKIKSILTLKIKKSSIGFDKLYVKKTLTLGTLKRFLFFLLFFTFFENNLKINTEKTKKKWKYYNNLSFHTLSEKVIEFFLYSFFLSSVFVGNTNTIKINFLTKLNTNILTFKGNNCYSTIALNPKTQHFQVTLRDLKSPKQGLEKKETINVENDLRTKKLGNSYKNLANALITNKPFRIRQHIASLIPFYGFYQASFISMSFSLNGRKKPNNENVVKEQYLKLSYLLSKFNVNYVNKITLVNLFFNQSNTILTLRPLVNVLYWPFKNKTITLKEHFKNFWSSYQNLYYLFKRDDHLKVNIFSVSDIFLSNKKRVLIQIKCLYLVQSVFLFLNFNVFRNFYWLVVNNRHPKEVLENLIINKEKKKKTFLYFLLVYPKKTVNPHGIDILKRREICKPSLTPIFNQNLSFLVTFKGQFKVYKFYLNFETTKLSYCNKFLILTVLNCIEINIRDFSKSLDINCSKKVIRLAESKAYLPRGLIGASCAWNIFSNKCKTNLRSLYPYLLKKTCQVFFCESNKLYFQWRNILFLFSSKISLLTRITRMIQYSLLNHSPLSSKEKFYYIDNKGLALHYLLKQSKKKLNKKKKISSSKEGKFVNMPILKSFFGKLSSSYLILKYYNLIPLFKRSKESKKANKPLTMNRIKKLSFNRETKKRNFKFLNQYFLTKRSVENRQKVLDFLGVSIYNIPLLAKLSKEIRKIFPILVLDLYSIESIANEQNIVFYSLFKTNKMSNTFKNSFIGQRPVNVFLYFYKSKKDTKRIKLKTISWQKAKNSINSTSISNSNRDLDSWHKLLKVKAISEFYSKNWLNESQLISNSFLRPIRKINRFRDCSFKTKLLKSNLSQSKISEESKLFLFLATKEKRTNFLLEKKSKLFRRYITLVMPSKVHTKEHLRILTNFIFKNRGGTVVKLIKAISPLIRSWCYYYKIISSGRIDLFSFLITSVANSEKFIRPPVGIYYLPEANRCNNNIINPSEVNSSSLAYRKRSFNTVGTLNSNDFLLMKILWKWAFYIIRGNGFLFLGKQARLGHPNKKNKSLSKYFLFLTKKKKIDTISSIFSLEQRSKHINNNKIINSKVKKLSFVKIFGYRSYTYHQIPHKYMYLDWPLKRKLDQVVLGRSSLKDLVFLLNKKGLLFNCGINNENWIFVQSIDSLNINSWGSQIKVFNYWPLANPRPPKRDLDQLTRLTIFNFYFLKGKIGKTTNLVYWPLVTRSSLRKVLDKLVFAKMSTFKRNLDTWSDSINLDFLLRKANRTLKTHWPKVNSDKQTGFMILQKTISLAKRKIYIPIGQKRSISSHSKHQSSILIIKRIKKINNENLNSLITTSQKQLSVKNWILNAFPLFEKRIYFRTLALAVLKKAILVRKKRKLILISLPKHSDVILVNHYLIKLDKSPYNFSNDGYWLKVKNL